MACFDQDRPDVLALRGVSGSRREGDFLSSEVKQSLLKPETQHTLGDTVRLPHQPCPAASCGLVEQPCRLAITSLVAVALVAVALVAVFTPAFRRRGCACPSILDEPGSTRRCTCSSVDVRLHVQTARPPRPQRAGKGRFEPGSCRGRTLPCSSHKTHRCWSSMSPPPPCHAHTTAHP